MNALQPSYGKLKIMANLLVILGAMLVVQFALQIAGLGVISWQKGVGYTEAMQTLSAMPPPNSWRAAILLLNGVASLGSFLGIPLVFYWFFNKGQFNLNPTHRPPTAALLGLGVLLLVALGPINAQIISWNENISLPGFMADFEAKARSTEDRLQLLTLYLINHSNTLEYVLIWLVVAVIPAVGEEMFFRGLLQPHLQRLINPHMAIWLAAVVFSAVHFQFYGFVPRVILGALFGYLYWISGRIEVPIVCHFVNNSVTFTVMQNTDIEPGSTLTNTYANDIPMWLVLVSVPAVVAVGWLFVQQSRLLKK